MSSHRRRQPQWLSDDRAIRVHSDPDRPWVKDGLTEAAYYQREYLRALRELHRLRAALPDPEKLRLLASFLDVLDRNAQRTNDEAQRDLRAWADAIEQAGET